MFLMNSSSKIFRLLDPFRHQSLKIAQIETVIRLEMFLNGRHHSNQLYELRQMTVIISNVIESVYKLSVFPV